MIKRSSGASGIRRYAEFESDGDVNPMETVANLSDVMLVLAVALMLALVAHWGLNIREAGAIDESAMEPIDLSSGELSADTADSSATYEEVGTVYRDVETGDLYVIQ